MLPWEMDRLTRFEVFEIYLKPDKDKQGSEPTRSHREQQFEHWMLGGYAKNWEECERLWQSRKK